MARTPLPADAVDLPPVAARFCRYVRIDTQSDPASGTVPSTERQKTLGRLLVSELRGLSLKAEMDQHGYVYATLPAAGAPSEPFVLGLVAHLDTSPDAPGAGVAPHIHPDYDGGPVVFPGDPALVLDADRQPALKQHAGHDLITSDGTTLLGSDDKAGVAILMQLAEDLTRGDAPRPEIRLLFTIDEEIGKGVDHLDLARFGADVAYTLDGGGTKTLEFETFNAAEAVATFRGVNVHPGYARGVMVDALRAAADFVLRLPAEEHPRTTSGRAGYFFAHTLASGTTSEATVRVLLRDFETDGLERRKALVQALALEAAAEHGARAEVVLEDSYRNMRAYIEQADPRAVSVALEAARREGFEPVVVPIRGGTDGARLSERGVPTPNVFTGGYDFHSVFEWNTVQNLQAALSYTHTLVESWTDALAPA